MAVVCFKCWHAQVFVHGVRVQMQTPDDVCLRFPCLRKLMHLLMHRRLPGTPRTRGRRFTSRGLAELPIRGDRLRWSKGRLLGVYFHLLACLTEHWSTSMCCANVFWITSPRFLRTCQRSRTCWACGALFVAALR